MTPDKYMALIELHIEQGPVLITEGHDVGIVEGVCGMINYEFTFKGQAGHAGTTPMKYRKDALYALLKPSSICMTSSISSTASWCIRPVKYRHTRIYTPLFPMKSNSRWTRAIRTRSHEKVVEIIKKIPAEVEKCKMTYQEAWARKTVEFTPALVDFVEKSAKDYVIPASACTADPVMTRSTLLT